MSRLLEHLRDEFIHAADPVKAPSMQRYMKSAMPYHGVPSTGMKAICRNVFTGLAFERSSEWEQAVIEIWEGAQFREERYAALILAGHRSAQRFQTPEALPLYERLIVAGAWWDIVDDVAIHRVGPLVRTHLSAMKSAMLDWATDANLWKRRASIICQVGSKKETDLDLLYACIEPSSARKTSGSARPSAGRCASTRGPIRPRWPATSSLVPATSAGSRPARPSGTFLTTYWISGQNPALSRKGRGAGASRSEPPSAQHGPAAPLPPRAPAPAPHER